MIDIDKKRRVLYLSGSVDDEHAHACLVFVQFLKGRPGTVVINSSGGSEEDGFACYDILRTAPKLTAIGVGQVQSAATLTFLACDNRFATENCAFMIHHGTYESSGPTHQRETLTMMKEVQRLDERYMQIVAERTRLPLKQVRRLMKHGHVFDAREAVRDGYALGITTRIGGRR